VRKLASRDFTDVSESMRRNIIDFYSGAGAATSAAEKPDERSRTLAAVEKLKTAR
jgi:hypothetical protein